MQYDDETVAQCSVASPTRQSHCLQQTRRKESCRRRFAKGFDNPKRQRRAAERDHGRFESAERDRQPPGILPRQPITREAWYETATDDRDQHEDTCNTHPDAVISRAEHMRLDVKRGVAKA